MLAVARVLVPAAVALGVLLRIAGAWANLQANDDHVEVIHVVATEGRLPRSDEFWEAFQPPLYHLVVAATIRTMPPMSRDRETRVAQAWSCAAGLATLALLIAFVRRVSANTGTTGLAIALTSLNPALIATSIQATNDAFVILFGSLALVAGHRYFERRSRAAVAVMTGAAILAASAKGNGLAVVAALLVTFAAANRRPVGSRGAHLRHAAAFTVLLALTVPWAGGYLKRQAEMGGAFATNMTPASPPDFLQESEAKRPGITSVAHGFLTFRLASLLRDPLLEVEVSRPGAPSYPLHRTSMWTLLYGGAHSVHHAYYPGSWRVGTDTAAWLVRLTAVAALVPTALMLWGLARGTGRAIGCAFRRTPSPSWHADVLLAAAAWGSLALIAVYGYRYRDFSTMKAIFVYPAAPAFAAGLVRGLDAASSRRAWMPVVVASGAVLALAYAVDVGVLVRWLLVQALAED
jgi:hypothetical protein